jgi:hypothetical protein
MPGFALLFFAFVAIRIFVAVRQSSDPETPVKQSFSAGNNAVVYKYPGNRMVFTRKEYDVTLSKYSVYYNGLEEGDKEKFIERTRRFIADKLFILHTNETYREMPILVAASAIQLSFGLDKYLFPHFKYIHIYPEEFLRTRPALCFLQGNVSGRSIRLSWKHFLQGLENKADGQDLGLHEMAHALYYQAFVIERHTDKDFRRFFTGFNDDGNKVYLAEQALEAGLYSRYAMQNLQEFWAESVEIFFEKPALMREKYPDLFNALKMILGQDLT